MVTSVEKLLEKLIYASRWIMAPIYLGLSLVLLALGIKFFQEVFHILPAVFSIKEVDLILVVLSLVALRVIQVAAFDSAGRLKVFSSHSGMRFWSAGVWNSIATSRNAPTRESTTARMGLLSLAGRASVVERLRAGAGMIIRRRGFPARRRPRRPEAPARCADGEADG